MLRYILLVFVFIFVVSVPQAFAQTSGSIDAVLLRIDAIILEMQALKREVQALKSGGAVLGAQTSKVLTQSLRYGDTNSDIAKIQKLLSTDPDIYAYGLATGFFGPKTQEAIRSFQSHFDLDPVGIIGPATTALLEGYFRMYPDENYPANIFDQSPQVLGASTTTLPPATGIVSIANPLRSINVEIDRSEALVEVDYKSGSDREFIVDSESEEEDDIIRKIVHKIGVREEYVREVISFSNASDNRSNNDDYNEGDAEDAIDDAEDAIDDAEDEIDDAYDDDEDVDYAQDTLDEAEDELRDAKDALDDENYDEAVERAEKAEKLAKKAEDRIGKEDDGSGEKGDSDEIESIEADVEEDESEIVVEYEDGSEYVFTVEEDKVDNIIEEVADELDIDEDDVEDLIEFDFGRLESIDVLIEDGEAEVVVEYRSGVTKRFNINEDNENDIIEEIADELDEDEEDVEDVIDFDYN